METIKIRRSVRKYTEGKIPGESIEKLLKAGMQAPSAANQRPWEFLVISERAELDKLADISPYAGMLKKAAAAVIPLGNTNRMTMPDFWQQDMAACTQNILLEAVNLELGAVWLGVAPLEERENFIRKQFSLDVHLIPFCIISLGLPAEGGGNRYTDRFDAARIHFGKY